MNSLVRSLDVSLKGAALTLDESFEETHVPAIRDIMYQQTRDDLLQASTTARTAAVKAIRGAFAKFEANLKLDQLEFAKMVATSDKEAARRHEAMRTNLEETACIGIGRERKGGRYSGERDTEGGR